jgi:hypothetical protein
MIRRLTRKEIEIDPNRIWNEFVAISLRPYETLDPEQRPGHLAFRYDAEVQNGGHLQYFENLGVRRLNESIAALEQIGASCHASVLTNAGEFYMGRQRSHPQTVSEYVDLALEGEFDVHDESFHKCKPSLMEHLEAYLKANQQLFVVIEGSPHTS